MTSSSTKNYYIQDMIMFCETQGRESKRCIDILYRPRTTLYMIWSVFLTYRGWIKMAYCYVYTPEKVGLGELQKKIHTIVTSYCPLKCVFSCSAIVVENMKSINNANIRVSLKNKSSNTHFCPYIIYIWLKRTIILFKNLFIPKARSIQVFQKMFLKHKINVSSDDVNP